MRSNASNNLEERNFRSHMYTLLFQKVEKENAHVLESLQYQESTIYEDMESYYTFIIKLRSIDLLEMNIFETCNHNNVHIFALLYVTLS